MSDFTRFRRSDPPRFTPNRYFSNLYRPVHKMNPDPRTGPYTPPGAAAPGQYGEGYRDQGVNSAYRVFNRSMPQGRGAEGPHSGPHAYGPKYRRGMATGLQALMDRAISSYGDMASMLMEAVNSVYGYGGGYEPDYREGSASPVDSSSPVEWSDTYLCTSFRVVLKSDRRCEVVLELVPTDPETIDPQDLDLIALDSSMKLNGIAHFDPAPAGDKDQRRILTVDARKDPTVVPSGVYQAKVFGRNKEQCGTLTLSIWDH